MITGNTQFEFELKKRIDEELVLLRSHLENRQVVQNYDNYQYLVGKIDALQSVASAFVEDVNTAINTR